MAAVRSLGRLEWRKYLHLFTDEFVQRFKFSLLKLFSIAGQTLLQKFI